MSEYGLPLWYVLLCDVVWYASRVWLRILAVIDRIGV